MIDVNIEIDYEKDNLFDDHGLARLKKGYLAAGETSPQQRFAFLARKFGSNAEHAQRLYKYMANHWWSNSTPVLAYGKNDKGLPISCFLSAIDDHVEDLIEVSSETRRMTVGGGGVGLYFGIREKGKKSSGVIAHMKTYDADTLAYKQAETRRGAYAAYLDVSHPEIIQFLDSRNPTGGDINSRALNMHIGVNLTDEFMMRVFELSTNDNLDAKYHDWLDKWPLISPENQEVVGYESVKTIWSKLIENRVTIGGEPYCHFIDNANKALPDYQKSLGLSIKQSNLCAEISLPTGKDIFGKRRSAVCCLGSVNLARWDEWKDDPLFISDMVEYLDNVLQVFIDEAPKFPGYEQAVYSATRERAIGIGALGWHDLLQQKSFPFGCPMAIGLNKRIWKHIKDQAMEANLRLAKERGPCPDSADHHTPVRMSRLLALAPNASSSIVLGTSPSCEPYRANAYLESGDVGIFTAKNNNLEKLLETLGKNNKKTWKSIVDHDGSVQHLDFLSDWDKEVYETAMEIDQRYIIQQAADRQEFICQSQSTNLFFLPTAYIQEIAMIHLMAWKMGLKSLYYCRSDTASKAKVGGKSERAKIDVDELVKQLQQDSICLACE